MIVFVSGIIASLFLLNEFRCGEATGFEFIENQMDEQDELIYALNTHFNDIDTFHSEGYKVVPQESNAAISEDSSLSVQSTGAIVAKGCFYNLMYALKLGVCTALFNNANVGLGSYFLTASVPSSTAAKPPPGGYSVFSTTASVYRTLDCTGTLVRQRTFSYSPQCPQVRFTNNTQYNWDWTVVPEMPDIPNAFAYGILIK